MKRFLIFIVLSLINLSVHAEQYDFENVREERLYTDIINETRCVVCQSQSVADSNSPFAQDIRAKIHQLILEKHDKSEINDYLRERYGDYIFLKPPLKRSTWLLWLFPFAFLASVMAWFGLKQLNIPIKK